LQIEHFPVQWQIQMVFLLVLIRERKYSFPICYLARTHIVIVIFQPKVKSA
jgi:hypothetical protein